VWEDGWADNDDWKSAIEKLKKDGKVKHFGISVNRWEPDNVLNTLQTGYIDAVQVIYNIFDQNPEDNLFPICRKLDIGVIARVPFDEGTLTGNLTKETTFPKGDWRATYFVPENLIPSVEHADALKPLLPQGMTMAEMALRFILCNNDVHTIIPGMRTVSHAESNISTSDCNRLDEALRQKLRKHRWDRNPTEWSQ
jgi:aryl-alcohol dehydrogenase-like predicted oxidoreductase